MFPCIVPTCMVDARKPTSDFPFISSRGIDQRTLHSFRATAWRSYLALYHHINGIWHVWFRNELHIRFFSCFTVCHHYLPLRFVRMTRWRQQWVNIQSRMMIYMRTQEQVAYFFSFQGVWSDGRGRARKKGGTATIYCCALKSFCGRMKPSQRW